MTGQIEVLIVGGGGIGSRHLQAIAASNKPLSITVVDPAEASREVARQRFHEITAGAEHKLSLTATLDDAPREIDVCIVATPAHVRRAVVEQLIAHAKVRYLILEKILFQTRGDYAAVARLLAEAGTKAWVNTPRRLWPQYGVMRDQIAGNGPVALHVVSGRRTALGTNSIHFLDTLDFLAGGDRQWTLRGDRLGRLEGGSRHTHAVEFQGCLYGFSDKGDVFSFTLHDDNTTHVLDISAKGYRWLVREAQSTALVASEAEGWAWREAEFPLVFQSRITGDVVADLLGKGDCALPTLAQSSSLHLAVLDAYFEALGLPQDAEDVQCPVT
ncbi:MAG TPA: Gfo/Idh/MocA family oxidoreductase [Magnetospirillum sp.]|nr:Gfo/Idh/MocA family oxidoreductase [Magnetospirillum sp.]